MVRVRRKCAHVRTLHHQNKFGALAASFSGWLTTCAPRGNHTTQDHVAFRHPCCPCSRPRPRWHRLGGKFRGGLQGSCDAGCLACKLHVNCTASYGGGTNKGVLTVWVGRRGAARNGVRRRAAATNACTMRLTGGPEPAPAPPRPPIPDSRSCRASRVPSRPAWGLRVTFVIASANAASAGGVVTLRVRRPTLTPRSRGSAPR